MPRLILRRLLISAVLLFVVSLLTFFLEAVTPGDTAREILGNNYTPQAYAQLRNQLGLDQPLLVQYWHWLEGAVRGDFGVSPISGLSVGSQVASRIGVTLSLLLATTAVAAVIGLALGVTSAVRGGLVGRVVDVLSLLGFALPNFWLGLVLVSLFAVQIRLFPATGYVSPLESPADWLRGLILPVVALSVSGIAVIAKQSRDGMLDALSRDFVRNLRANGASEASVVFRHALRNAAIPVVTVTGLLFVSLLNGTVLVESVFAMPGLGGLAVQSTTQHDLPTIQAVALTFALIVVIANLLTDLAYGWLNPKVRAA